MKRIFSVLAVAVLMAAMLAVTASVALAAPPAGGGGTGREAGLENALRAIGTGFPSGENRAPYRDQPLGEKAQGNGPDHGFNTSEGRLFALKN